MADGDRPLRRTHIHPASAILLAYIFPISPIPMIPTTASPILAAALHKLSMGRVVGKGISLPRT
ncbi:hypothetical protein DOTSEDRAFT_73944 [Dothistroma septosporum NZE10]|uniref:Uncharacterized protein n=1 Tax=Dothistroma septosporum (strain NZE10 / CBS 128990) TaxID=675120 RepID=N1PHA7_DOTSN|nr:hypothetical protein DOTSEDRAFT_73944 [Dothistroma septosporum NZE10]